MNDHISTALRLTPVVERVHGAHHPELTRVRELTEQMGSATSDFVKEELFHDLRVTTHNYALPNDACEAFAATYHALESAEKEHLDSRAEV